jgi:hypothetical protein
MFALCFAFLLILAYFIVYVMVTLINFIIQKTYDPPPIIQFKVTILNFTRHLPLKSITCVSFSNNFTKSATLL